MTVEVVTFGCRLNTYESEVIKKKALENGLNDVFIINSCAVTSEAERQLRQEIRKIKKNNPDKKIIVTGCAVQINPAKYDEMSEVYSVIGNIEKLQDSSYANINKSINNHQDKGEKVVADIMLERSVPSAIVERFDGKVRGYVQVQGGCNHRCTFCIIPYGRGNSRSTPFKEIFDQGKNLVENGYKELVITGVDITDYGLDLPGKPSLGQLVKRLLKYLPDLPRIRLSSIDVAEVDNDLMDLIANEPRFMPHLHLSLQSGDNMILKRMKRRHSREQVIDFCRQVINYRPEVVFGADIIAGFPTETDEMFQNTYDLLNDLEKIIHLHIFPYSEREGTPAARMPQVEKKVRKERAAKLRILGDLLMKKYIQSQIGKEINVLVENKGYGRGEDFCMVEMTQQEDSIGSINKYIIKGVNGLKIVV
jgi:threonylcarbamoyladenosine tRNA methylthiotransferase MtaB